MMLQLVFFDEERAKLMVRELDENKNTYSDREFVVGIDYDHTPFKMIKRKGDENVRPWHENLY